MQLIRLGDDAKCLRLQQKRRNDEQVEVRRDSGEPVSPQRDGPDREERRRLAGAVERGERR